MRYMVGLGAGKQKIQINAQLIEKSSGKVLKSGRIVDRKIGGLVGGSENKGKRDFAEKTTKFIRQALGMKEKKTVGTLQFSSSQSELAILTDYTPKLISKQENNDIALNSK